MSQEEAIKNIVKDCMLCYEKATKKDKNKHDPHQWGEILFSSIIWLSVEVLARILNSSDRVKDITLLNEVLDRCFNEIRKHTFEKLVKFQEEKVH